MDWTSDELPRQRMGKPRKPPLGRRSAVALALVAAALLFGFDRFQLHVLRKDGAVWAEERLLEQLREEGLAEVRAAQRAASSPAERAKVPTRIPGAVEVLAIDPVSRWEFLTAGRRRSFAVRVVARTDLDPEPREFVLQDPRRLGSVAPAR